MTSIETAVLQSTFSVDQGRLIRELATPAGVFRSSMELNELDGQDGLGDWWRHGFAGVRPESDRAARGTARVVDLFCGPGGLALGFRQAADELGIDVISAAAVDQDDEAVEVYAANHGARRRSSESVSALVDFQVSGVGNEAKFVFDPELLRDDWSDLVGNTDVILAGPPCQGHSNLNNSTRRTDRRNELYLTVPAMAIALRAPVVIIENVPAVVHDRQQVVASTENLLRSAGYQVTTGVIAAAKLGWPQSRQRFFLVARLDVAPLSIAEVSLALSSAERNVLWAIEDLATRPFDEKMHFETELSEENQRRINWLFDSTEYNLPPSERPDCHKDGTTYGAVYGRLYPNKPAPTITTGFLTPGRGRYIHPTQRRTLTPREAARIQGFPDTYEFHVSVDRPPTKQKLTKWIGDAVPMPLGHAAALAALGPGWDR